MQPATRMKFQRSNLRRAAHRVATMLCENLEPRRLLSSATLLPISLANDFPNISSQNPGSIAYSGPSTGQYTITSTDISLLQGTFLGQNVTDAIGLDSANTRQ